MKMDKIFQLNVRNFALKVLTFVFLVMPQVGYSIEKKDIPDFAFPVTVKDSGRVILKEACEKNEWTKALRAAMDIIIAENLISPDSISGCSEILNEIVDKAPYAYAAISLLLKAQMLKEFYLSNSRIFNNRKLPLNETWPEDPQGWSKELYVDTTLRIVEQIENKIKYIPTEGISKISLLLDDFKEAENAGMTIVDFLLLKSSEILGAYSNEETGEIIPFFPQQPLKENVLGACRTERKRLIEEVINRNRRNNTEIMVLGIIEKSKFLNGDQKYYFLKDWSEKLIDEAADGNVFYTIWQNFGSNLPDGNIKEYYEKMNFWIDKFTESRYAGSVKNILAELSDKRISVTIPDNILPNKSIQVSAELININEGYILIYKLGNAALSLDGSLNINKFPGNASLIKSIPIKSKGEIPFDEKILFDLPPLTEGYYVALPSKTEILSKQWKDQVGKWSLSPFRVTAISILSSSDSRQKNSSLLYVVSSLNQKPLKGAKVNFYSDTQKRKLIKTLYTGEDGSCIPPEGYYLAEAVYGKSKNILNYGYRYYPERVKETPHAKIFTDLSIYRPGDSVRFEVIAWMENQKSQTLIKDHNALITLRDANYQIADTLNLCLNNEGRAWGKMLIPEGRLLGTYRLLVELPSVKGTIAGVGEIEVSDYKIPPFQIAFNYELGDENSNNKEVIIKGDVNTYSGMPLPDSEIKLEIDYNQFHRWMYDAKTASFVTDTISDQNGNFIFRLPLGNLKGTNYETGIYTINVTATSITGESVKAQPVKFVLGEEFQIRPAIPSEICLDSDSLKLYVPVYNAINLPEKREINYKVYHLPDSVCLSEGNFLSPVFSIPCKNFTSGKYKFEFSLKEGKEKFETECIFFRKDDTKVPIVTPLWTEDTEYTVKDGEQEIEIKFGSAYPESYILCMISNSDGFVKRDWLKVNEEMSSVIIPAPKEYEKTYVTLSGLHEFERVTKIIIVNSAYYNKKLNVTASSFRDHLTAGNKEKWSFRFSMPETEKLEVSALAVMTDKAMNALKDFKWSFYTGNLSGIYNSSTINYNYLGSRVTNAHFSKRLKFFPPVNLIPNWQTYGYSLAGFSNVLNGGIRLLRKENSVMTRAVVDGEEMAVEMEAPLAFNSMKMASADTSAGNTAYESEDMEEEAQTVFMEGGKSDSKKEEFRPIEKPVAFFQPNLRSNEDGILEVSFEVPDFNTTWQFQLAGYTDDLKTVTAIMDAVSSKPVMVKGNFPLFVRTGDDCEISALLFNNTEDEALIVGKIEIINPNDNEIIEARNFDPVLLPPSSSAPVTMICKIPSDTPYVLARTYAFFNEFSDGEQTLIPILPSSTPVLESTQFYMGENQDSIEIKLPKYKKNDNVTLRLCDNPVWEVLLALPDLSTPESSSIVALARSLSVNHSLSFILSKYPEISEAIKSAVNEGDTLAFTSNLQKNTELKISGLDVTPWVNEAIAETQRMRNLNELSSEGKLKDLIQNQISQLISRQNKDGGWSWCEGFRSSDFITYQVLLNLGESFYSASLPSEFEDVIKKAMNYCDRELIARWKRYPNVIPANLLDYFYMRSFFNVKDSKDLKELKEIAFKEIKNNWRHYSVREKAKAALLLYRSSNFNSESELILSSLEQYATKSNEKGWWYASINERKDPLSRLLTTSMVLNAYMEINPSSEAVRGIRQWLVLQKETENWGNNDISVNVIHSLLNSGINYSISETLPEIFIDGSKIKIDRGETLTGILTVSLIPSEISGKKMKIINKGERPLWGGVISQYVAPISDIRKIDCENLSIEKKIYAIDEKEGKEILTDRNLKKGDMVRVTLTIHCKKDMEYVNLIDDRSACLEPRNWISGISFIDGLPVYMETRTDRTSLFIENLSEGIHILTYDCYVTREGEYSNGIAKVQSLYSPLQAAHSKGSIIKIY